MAGDVRELLERIEVVRALHPDEGAVARSARDSESSRASGLEKSSAALRQMRLRTGGNRWDSMAETTRGGSSGSVFRVPKLPSFRWRPARPAICGQLVREEVSLLAPSNLESPAKATWSRSRFSPIPMASVATRYWTSPDWYIATWALRVLGESAPSTTATPPRRRRSASASS